MSTPGSVEWLVEILGGTGDAAETYAVLPSGRLPRLLVSVDHPKAIIPGVSGASFLSGDLGRVLRPLLAASTLVGLDRLLGRRIAVPAKGSLSSAIAGCLGEDSVSLAIVAGPVRPNQKPVARVLNTHGETLAFAKIGWNEYTNDLVLHEADALSEITAPAGVQVPEVIALLSHGYCKVLVVSAIQLEGARPPAVAPVRLLERIVAEHPVSEVDFVTSAWWRSALVGAASIALSPEASEWIGQFPDSVQRSMLVARCHGDWAPWNLLESPHGWGVLDWERSRSDAPLGIDLAHQAIQTGLARGGSVAEATAQAVATIERASFHDPTLVLAPARELVAMYLLEFWLRLGLSGRTEFDGRMSELVANGAILLRENKEDLEVTKS
jgi:Phosphotransferase enzyme family